MFLSWLSDHIVRNANVDNGFLTLTAKKHFGSKKYVENIRTDGFNLERF
jgi:hypothetical protein